VRGLDSFAATDVEVEGGHPIMRKLLFVVVAVCLIGIAVGWTAYFGPSRRLMALLSGEKHIAISFAVFESGGKQLTLRETPDLEYLSNKMSSATYVGYMPTRSGGQAKGWVTFSFGSAVIRIIAPEELDGVFVSPDYYSSIGDPVYYWVQFNGPVPKSIEAFLKKLNEKS
jgi:hypothetical protein